MTNKLPSLIEAVQNQLQQWLSLTPQRPWPNNVWIYGLEGGVYIRWNPALERIDLANFSIKKKYQNRGIAREIIKNTILFNLKCVRIEGLHKNGWFTKISKYEFVGYQTMIRDQGNLGIQFDVDFVKKQ